MEKLKKKNWGKLLQENSALLSLILLLLLATIFKGEVFLNYKNIINIFLNNAIIGVIALGMTLVIITGGIDLSVGSQIALSGLIAVSVFNATGSAFIAVVAAILFGILTSAMCGAIRVHTVMCLPLSLPWLPCVSSDLWHSISSLVVVSR